VVLTIFLLTNDMIILSAKQRLLNLTIEFCT